MGIFKYFSSGKSSANYEQAKVSPVDPNPGVFRILKHREANGNLAVMINYPNCTNYEGNKIIVYRGVTWAQVKNLSEIDPHFIETGKIRPFARFVPDDNGWETATQILSLL